MAWELSLINETTHLVACFCISTVIGCSADAVTEISCGSTQGDSLCSKELNSGISPTLLLLSYEQS